MVKPPPPEALANAMQDSIHKPETRHRGVGLMSLKDIEELREILSELNQTLLELSHAQKNGPGWYTKGDNGMYQQVSMWLSRGFDAIRKADKLMPEDYKVYS